MFSFKSRGFEKRSFRFFVCAVVSLWLIAPGFAQESVWSSYNDVGSKFFEDKEYAKAEKVLVDAVKEAEKLPNKDGQKLLTSLRLLRKVYLAMGKGSQVSQVESRLRSLGDATTESSSSSGFTEDPASDPALAKTLASQQEPAADPDAKGVVRDKDEPPAAVTRREKEFTIQTSAPAKEEPESAPAETEAPREVASAAGIPGLYGGSKKAQQVLQLFGHAGWTKTCDISADGRKALSGSQDNSIRLWNLETGKEIGKFEGHEDDVNCVIFSPSGSNALSGGSDKTVRLWDIDLGTELKKFEGHQNLVTCVAFAESGTRIASGGYDGTVRVWDTATGKQIKQLEGKLGTVRAVAFTPDGEQVVSGGTDKVVTLWNIKDGTVARQFNGHKGEISSIAVSSDGTKILSSSRDLTIQLWDLTTGEPLKLLQGHTNWIQKAEFLSNDRAISGALDKTIRLWDLNYAKELDSYKIPPFGMWSVSFTKKGDHALTGSDDFSLRYWNLP